MDSNLNTITIYDFTDLVKREFEMVAMNVTPNAQQLFQLDEVGLNNGEFRLYEEYDQDTFASAKAQGQNVSKARAGVGYSKQAKVRRFGVEIDITDEMRKFNKYPEVKSKLTNLTSYAKMRLELDLTHRITFSNATSYVDRDGNTIDTTVGDGLALASATHALKYSTTTWSNIVSGNPAFSRTGLEAAELLASTQIFNNFGEKHVMNFNKIWFADNPTTENLVLEILQSVASVASGVNAGVKNVYQNKYEPVKLPFLATLANGSYDSTKKNWWGLAATGSGEGAWQAYNPIWEQPYLIDPVSTPSLVDGHADIWTYGVRVSYDIAIVSGRGFIVSQN
jgi:hypothetical protein